MGTILLGAVVGSVVSWLVLPDLMAAAALGGGMVFGAARVFLFLSTDRSDNITIRNQDGSFQ